jgi:hypothetical protein
MFNYHCGGGGGISYLRFQNERSHFITNKIVDDPYDLE